MSARTTLESLSVQSIQGPEGHSMLVRAGEAIFQLAARAETRERFEITKARDLETKKPLALWSRQLSDGPHSLTLTPWSDRSYVLYDVRKPEEENEIPGFLRVYMFGGDQAVSGLAKGMKVMELRRMDQVPSRRELEEKIGSYARHPTHARYITSAVGTGKFVRLIKSSIERP